MPLNQGIYNYTYCPSGSQQKPVSACPATFSLAIDTVMALSFGGAIPAQLAPFIAGIDMGSIAAADLCSNAPLWPGTFDWAWLADVYTNAYGGALLTWMQRVVYWYWWNACCVCKLPSVPDFQDWGGNTFISPATQAAVNGPDNSQAWNVKVLAQWTEAGIFAAGFSGVLKPMHSTPVAGACNSGGTALSLLGNNLKWSAGSCAGAGDLPNGAWGTVTNTLPVLAAAYCLGVQAVGLCGGGTSFQINTYYAIQPTGPLALSPLDVPPNVLPTGPSGFSTTAPILRAPTPTLAACNFAPISANRIEQNLVPQSRVAIGSPHIISGANNLVIPAGAVGMTFHVLVPPVGYSHDAGDPEKLYGVGWYAPSTDGVELVTPPIPVSSFYTEFWGFKPTDAHVAYNVFPAGSCSIQFWGTGTPT